MNDIAISLKNVSKYYKLYNSPQDRLKEALSFSDKKYHKKFYATKNLNLEIKKGEILGIVGKNGSGKSTLLKLITGVLTPDEGSIKVNGKISALLELGSGFNPEFTGMQNIFFYGTILGFTKKEMEEKLEDILTFADIGDFIDQPLKTYSSGMKSRLGFAVAVHIDPEILILDEVLAVGDILFKRKCYAKMEEFFKGGKTIIYVSHDANSVNELCTRAIFLHNGNILIDGQAKDITKYYQKFIFSTLENQQKLIEALYAENINKPIKNTQTKEKKISIDKTDYLEIFQSSPVFINENIAKIENIFIKDNNNKMINVLHIENTYKVSFKVTFLRSINNAYFGVQIMSIKGLLLSGANSKDVDKKTITVQKNDILLTEMSFLCNLLPGEYTLKVFAGNKVEDEALILDAYIFKVAKHKKSQGGIFTLNQSFSFSKLD